MTDRLRAFEATLKHRSHMMRDQPYASTYRAAMNEAILEARKFFGMPNDFYEDEISTPNKQREV